MLDLRRLRLLHELHRRGTVGAVAAFWDMMPTLCEVAGAQTPADIDGISFVPTLVGEGQQAEPDYLYWEFPAYGNQQAVRAGDWKAVRHNVNRRDTEFELYNLEGDIAEQHNVAGENPDVVRRMKEIAQNAHTESQLFPLLAGEKRTK
jgi:arylsulfatase A